MMSNTWARQMMRHAPRRTRPKNQHHFGPGRLESITLYERTSPRGGYRQHRVEGTFTVYCGYGWDHTVYLNGMWADDRVLDGATEPEDMASLLVEWELEEWSDPCETMPAED